MLFAASRASFSRLLLLLVLQLAIVPDIQRMSCLVQADGGYMYNSNDECQALVKSSLAVRNKAQNQLPKCTCGDTAGSLASINFNQPGSRPTTTLSVCSGCSGQLVPVTSSALCDTAPDPFSPFLNLLCKGVLGICQDITFYRCSNCPTTTPPLIPLGTIPNIVGAITGVVGGL